MTGYTRYWMFTDWGEVVTRQRSAERGIYFLEITAILAVKLKFRTNKVNKKVARLCIFIMWIEVMFGCYNV